MDRGLRLGGTCTSPTLSESEIVLGSIKQNLPTLKLLSQSPYLSVRYVDLGPLSALVEDTGLTVLRLRYSNADAHSLSPCEPLPFNVDRLDLLSADIWRILTQLSGISGQVNYRTFSRSIY